MNIIKQLHDKLIHHKLIHHWYEKIENILYCLN